MKRTSPLGNAIQVVLILLSLSACTAKKDNSKKELNGLWESTNGEFMYIDGSDKTDNLLSNNLTDQQAFLFEELPGDTLNFYTEVDQSGDSFRRNYKFQILSRSESSLVLMPYTYRAQDFFNGNSKLVFHKKEYAVQPIDFDSVEFHVNRFDKEIMYQELKIFRDRKIYIQNETYADDEESRIQNYTGILSRSKFDKLSQLIRDSHLDLLKDSGDMKLSHTLPIVIRISKNGKSIIKGDVNALTIIGPLYMFIRNELTQNLTLAPARSDFYFDHCFYEKYSPKNPVMKYLPLK